MILLAKLRAPAERQRCIYISQSGQSAAPPFVVVDDGVWVGPPKFHASVRKNRSRRPPRLVNPRIGHLRQFGNPMANVFTGGIELFALQNWIKDPEVRSCICATTSYPLPPHRVIGQVGIYQRVPEPSSPFLPRNQQVLHEERCGYHSRPIVHPPGDPQFAHTSVNERIAGLATCPG